MMAKRKNAAAKSEQALHKIPLRITDTTLRDAHQSLWATRMRTDDILRIIDVIDSVGYYSLEVWGGATFDVCLRFLRENPWERLRIIKSKAKNTPLQMLLRGQNLVGYRNYADDVVDKFVHLACENGIDIFRVFDALNDARNLAAAIRAVKRYGGHAQGTLSYTVSPVHTVEKYVQLAVEQVELGVDSLCIKDMAGILTPIAAEKLVRALIDETDVPVQLHCHATSGMATATYVEGVRAGAGAIDCAISPLAGFSAQPPVETLASIFQETNYSADLDFDALQRVAGYFKELAPRRRPEKEQTCIIDPGVLLHQIPGGMISNFRSQLEMQGALDRLPEVLEEVSKVREDLGYPPLVTPTSQIVGTQAVMNVLAGERYKIVPNEVKDYCLGKYGRSPAAIKKEILEKILGDEKPITGRPADDIKPMLPNATDGLDPDLVEHEEDIISYSILPEPSLEYFRWRKLAPEKRSEIPADAEIRKMKEADEASLKPRPIPAQNAPGGELPAQMINSEDYRGLTELLGRAERMNLGELAVQKGDFRMVLRAQGAGDGIDFEPITASSAASLPVPEPKTVPESTPNPSGGAHAHTIDSPLGGTFYLSPGPGKPAFVAVGDTVSKGQQVCTVEAMKLFNAIQAPQNAKVVALLAKEGENVEKGQPLIAFEPA